MVKKASGDLMANARDLRVGVNLIGLTNFISTVVGPNLTSCHLKLILVTPLGSKTRKLGAFGSYIPTDCSQTSLSFCRGSRVQCRGWRVEGIFYKRLCYSEKDN